MSTRKPDRSDLVCTDSPEGFYVRWSRRKRVARANDDANATDVVKAVGDDADQSGEVAAVPEPAPLTDADMPPLETLDGSSDFSGFMSSGVSEELRNKALRKFFFSSQFNVVDGLDDYDDDFTAFQALGDLVTSDMRHQLELAEQRAREAAESEAAADARTAPSDDSPPADNELADTASATAPVGEPLPTASEAAGRESPPARDDDDNGVSADTPAPSEEDNEHGGDGGTERA